METPTVALGLYCKSISGQVLTTSNQPPHCFKQQPGTSSAAAGASFSYQLATRGSAAFLAVISVASLIQNGVCSAWPSCTGSCSGGFGGELGLMRADLLSFFSWGLCWAVVATSASPGMVLVVAFGVPSPGALCQQGEAVPRGWSPEDENTECGYHVHPSQARPGCPRQALALVLPRSDLQGKLLPAKLGMSSCFCG